MPARSDSSTLPKPKPKPWVYGMRFGELYPLYVDKAEKKDRTKREVDKIYATYCNAGLRIYDIADAANPREVASFVAPDPDTIMDPRPYDREFDIFHGGSRVACTQDVLVDPRGYIYLSGANDGIWIVKETGA